MSDAREAIAAAMIRCGLATGHGDTLESLLTEMEWQVTRLYNRVEWQSHCLEHRDGWEPIETKPPFVECEERGIYTDAPGGGLFYFKPTHWRPTISPAIRGGE